MANILLPPKPQEVVTNNNQLVVTSQQVSQLLSGLGIREAQTALFKAFKKDFSSNSGFGELEQITTYTGARVVNWVKLYRRDSDKSESPLVILPIVVIRVGIDKEVVRTPLVGRNSTVKEIITNGDWSIDIQGVIFNYDNANKYREFPKEKIRELRQAIEVTDSLTVISPYLNDVFNIHKMVVNSATIEQIDNSSNSVRFNIQAFSDVDFEIKL